MDGPIGPVVGFQFEPLSLVPGQDRAGTPMAWDIMSYSGGPNWVSAFTYCSLFDAIPQSRVACPASVEGGRVGPTGSRRRSDSIPRDRSVQLASVSLPAGALFPVAAASQVIHVSGYVRPTETAWMSADQITPGGRQRPTHRAI